MEDNIFDKIVALRISLMDTYYDEKTIIYYIKRNLHRYDGYQTEEDLNNVIIEFYKRYDIDITTINLNEINVVNQPQSSSSHNINNLLSLFNILNSLQNPSGAVSPNNNYNNNTSTSTNNIESTDVSELDTDTEGIYENDINSEDYNNSETINDSESVNSNFFFNLNNTQNSNINPEHFLSVINTFNNVLNNVNTTTYNQEQEFEDVTVTLDDKDYQNLNEINYKDLNSDQKSNLDSKCSICLVDLMKILTN